jgi:hypothetical protein
MVIFTLRLSTGGLRDRAATITVDCRQLLVPWLVFVPAIAGGFDQLHLGPRVSKVCKAVRPPAIGQLTDPDHAVRG